MQFTCNDYSATTLLFPLLLFYVFNGARTWTSLQKELTDAAAAIEAGILPLNMQSNHGQPYFIHPVARVIRSVGVTIVIVVTEDTKLAAYETALNSVRCYAALHGYNLSIEFDNKFDECGIHSDNFFKRHCHIHKLMQNEIQHNDWVLFIDGDVGVVNPNRLIEDYIVEGYDIYLYDRFFNWEYAAQYLVRNNERGRDWVEQFANYELKLPNSFHGTDNGALHFLMMNYLVPETRNSETRSRTADLCYSLWKSSAGFDALFATEACTRMIIGERLTFPEQKVKIYEKGKGWARDVWMFHSHWSPDDFMLHALKETQLSSFPLDKAGRKFCSESLLNVKMNNACRVVFPVLNKLDIKKCEAGTEKWLMEGRLQIDFATRKRVYDTMARRILKKQMESIGTLRRQISKM